MYFPLIIFLLLNTIVWANVFDLSRSAPLEVSFFNLDSGGDATLIKIGFWTKVLIDGGWGREILQKLSEESMIFDKDIDLVVLTHPDKDHLEGLIAVFEKYDVHNVSWTKVQRNTALCQIWKEALKKEKARERTAKLGEKAQIGKVALSTIFPFQNLEETETKQTNQTSVVNKLSFGQTSFLFTGDITKKEEIEILEQSSNLKADVLKVAHHGSKTSSSQLFLTEVAPQIAIAEVQENNPYGYPHQEVVDRFQKLGIRLMETGRERGIKILSDSYNLVVINRY